jgi:hypothetical protein
MQTIYEMKSREQVETLRALNMGCKAIQPLSFRNIRIKDVALAPKNHNAHRNSNTAKLTWLNLLVKK